MPVNLTVHRNTLERRKQRKVSSDLVSAAKRQSNRKDIAGFAIVSWDKDLNALADWQCNRTMPGDALGAYVKRVIERTVNRDDTEETIWGPDDSA